VQSPEQQSAFVMHPLPSDAQPPPLPPPLSTSGERPASLGPPLPEPLLPPLPLLEPLPPLEPPLLEPLPPLEPLLPSSPTVESNVDPSSPEPLPSLPVDASAPLSSPPPLALLLLPHAANVPATRDSANVVRTTARLLDAFIRPSLATPAGSCRSVPRDQQTMSQRTRRDRTLAFLEWIDESTWA
jgi:hypothetical protein